MHDNHDNNMHRFLYVQYIKWLTDAPFRMNSKEQAIKLLPGRWIKVSLALASKLATNQRIYHLQSRDANAFRRTESASKPKQSSSLAFRQELWLLQDQTANTCKRYRYQKISISNRPQDHVTKNCDSSVWQDCECAFMFHGGLSCGVPNDLFPSHCFDTFHCRMRGQRQGD